MNFLIPLFVVVALVGATLDYFSRPVVGFADGGICVYIIEKGVKRDCDRTPTKYIREHVANYEQRQIVKP